MPIDGLIPQQNFELVRDRIGSILATEFGAQKVLSGNDNFYNITVETGRTSAINYSEMPYINVMTGRMNFDNSNQGQDDNLVTYYVDVYAKSKATQTKGADVTASTLLLKYLGVVRAILVNPLYSTLSFEPGIIMSRQISDIQFQDPKELKNSVTTQMARIVYEVRMIETAETYQDFETVNSSYTTVKIGQTEQGYLWIIEEGEPSNLVAFSGDNLVAFGGDNLVSLN